VRQCAFEYRAFDAAGAATRGVESAASAQDVYRLLVARRLTPTSVRPARTMLRRSRRIRTQELAHVTRQLAVLLAARIPLSEGLQSIADQERAGPTRELMQDLARRVAAGEGIASAIDAHADLVSDVFLESIRAGERSGNLAQVLEHLSETLERSHETGRQVRGALMYPACVVSVLGLATIFLIAFIVPRFAEMFSKRGAELPALTRALMSVGTSLQHWWWGYAAAAIAAFVLLRFWWRRPAGRLRLDACMHRVPILRQLLMSLGIGRFGRVLGLSMASGLGLIECLSLAGKSSGRPMLAAEAERMAARVRAGARLTDALATSTYLPAFPKRMLSAGEASGDISAMCAVISRHYEREAAALTRNLATIIEPVLVVAVAAVVLAVALAIFLPIWDLVKVVG
jgi:type II secretory pathway component PulF